MEEYSNSRLKRRCHWSEKGLETIDENIKSLLDGWKKESLATRKALPFYLRIFRRGEMVWFERGRNSPGPLDFFDEKFQRAVKALNTDERKTILKYERLRSGLTYAQREYSAKVKRLRQVIEHHKKLANYERKERLRN